MSTKDSLAKAQSYLETLCRVKPNRRTGSPGNRQATEFFAETIGRFGYEIDASPFECLDYVCDAVALTHDGMSFDVRTSPYSLGCDVVADLIAVSTPEELEGADCRGKILLMTGAICSEQLMPKSFVFYNPERHQRLIHLLESLKPAAIITATEKKPEQVGALYPFPLIVDGEFDISSVYCRDSVGVDLAEMQGEVFRLEIDARRLPSSSTNVVSTLNHGAPSKVVITAHIDAYEDSPGASDNASGTVVLLLCAELLSNYRGGSCIEIAALNGEDHYSAAGQMDYLKRHGEDFPQVALAANVDDVGYRQGRTSYSFYECPPLLESAVEAVLGRYDGLVRGEPWFSGDHMIFVQSGLASMAFTSEYMPELMRTITHTSADTPDIIDCRKLVDLADSVDALVRSL